MIDEILELDAVREYYGKTLKDVTGLRTNACCSNETIPPSHREVLEAIDDEIKNRFYGCGSPIPAAIEGCTVLDLGCGSGRDVYLASRLVGPEGRVIGVDMTEEQLAVARRHRESQAKRFGMPKSNVEFRSGYMEDLGRAGNRGRLGRCCYLQLRRQPVAAEGTCLLGDIPCSQTGRRAILLRCFRGMQSARGPAG